MACGKGMGHGEYCCVGRECGPCRKLVDIKSHIKELINGYNDPEIDYIERDAATEMENLLNWMG